MRSSGLLLHVTSLPSRFGIGDLGPEARRFVDILAETGQTWWQLLPVCPAGLGDSPYASPSSFAGNPLLISSELLAEDGWVTELEIDSYPAYSPGIVDYPSVATYKSKLLKQAFSRFIRQPRVEDFQAFVNREADWLLPYAAFRARKLKHQDKIWTGWPTHDRTSPNKESLNPDLPELQFYLFEQFIFDSQWRNLCDYCRKRNVKIMGDLPIYVAHDSADVWASPELFQLDDAGEPLVVAGVPPDFFSNTGQRWGNPIYRWEVMAERGFKWWIHRMKRAWSLYDSVRLDHFRGFAGYWEIPATEETAVHGRWVRGPGQIFFDQLESEFGPLPVIAENLGVITPDVVELMENNSFPGMAVIQFGFDAGMDNPHLPHNYQPNQCVYTGTHDNDTLRGWWDALSGHERAFAGEYLQIESDENICPKAIERCLASDADLVITPVQDVLGLDGHARMNFPGTAFGNWRWRLSPRQQTELREKFGRWLHDSTSGSRRLSVEN